jgi:hypothetical protein
VLYDNWDCSSEAFEGIRAQDILPLLIDNFHFEFFVTFGNVIDPFIDRTFGPNFSITDEWDLAFIDRVHARDEAEMARGAIKPTHILAAMRTSPPGRTIIEDGFPPDYCVRWPSQAPVPTRELADPVLAAKSIIPAAQSDVHEEIGAAGPQDGGDSGFSVVILPANPSSFVPIVARITIPHSRGTTIERVNTLFDGTVIRIRIVQAIERRSVALELSRAIDVRLGQFPAGSYEVAVDMAQRQLLARCSFKVVDVVVPGQSIRPLVDYTDLWWNPQEPGWGLSIHQHASDAVFATWLTFDQEHDPIWYSLQPGRWTGTSSYSGPIYMTRRGSKAGPESTGAVQSIQVGTGAIEFADYASGMFTFTVQGVVTASRIARMIY